jgi:ferredoxin-NADP reductase
VPARLLYSSRTQADIIFRAELDALAARRDGPRVIHTLTRGVPPGWTGYSRRIDAAMLAETGFPSMERPKIFVCGPTSLVESASRALVDLGHEARLVKTERFGPTGA